MHLNSADHTCLLSRFCRETPDFEDFFRSQQKISRYHDFTQDFLNLKINQFFEKLMNFVRESCLLKGKEYTSIPASTDFIDLKKIICNLAFTERVTSIRIV